MRSFIVNESFKMARQLSVVEQWNNLEELWFTFICIKLQGYLITRRTHATVWMKPDWKERGFIRHRISAADCIEKKKIREEWDAKEKGVKIDVCKYRLSSLPITMAFGYILNAMERLVRWGMLPGAQPKEDVEDTHTQTYSTCRVSVPWESTTVQQDQLLAGCWRGHAV